jgi:GTP-binding protein
VLTKSDKLTKTEAAKVLSITRLQAGGGDVMLFSAPKRQGIEDVAQLLYQWAHPEEFKAKKKSADAKNSTEIELELEPPELPENATGAD